MTVNLIQLSKGEKKEQGKKKEAAKEEKKLEQLSGFEFKSPKGDVLYLKEDGRVYTRRQAFGAIVESALSPEEVCELVSGKREKKKEEVLLRSLPSKSLKLPLVYARAWGQQLLEYCDESLCVYGVERKPEKGKSPKWLGVCPEQKVTGGSVDVDDFGNAAETLSSKGYRLVGTLHTHPGGMTHCSGTDTGQLWNRFAGIHLIITHTGIMSFWFSNRTMTWKLGSTAGFENVKLWMNQAAIPKALLSCISLLGEDGGWDYKKFIKRKVYSYKTTKGGVWYSGSKSERYFGKWNPVLKEFEQERQRDHQWVSITYVDMFGGYFDTYTNKYYSGIPSKEDVKRQPFRYTVKVALPQNQGDKKKQVVGKKGTQHRIMAYWGAKKQHDGTWVAQPYTEMYTSYFDSKQNRFFAGKPTEEDWKNGLTGITIIRESDKKQDTGKTLKEGLWQRDSLTAICDSMSGLSNPKLEVALFNNQLDTLLVELAERFENLEKFVGETIGLTDGKPDEAVRKSIVRMLDVLPQMEYTIWGVNGKTKEKYQKMLPEIWKG